MKELKLTDKAKAIVIVAHPDDEMIWMGGTILRNRGVDWTVFSLCRRSDKDRYPKFRRVMEHIGARGIITDLEDEDIMDVDESVPKIQDLIKDKIGEQNFDYLFFHGPEGEYGHPRHIGVHRAVAALLKGSGPAAGSALQFNYERINEREMKAKDDSDYFFELTEEEFKEKRRIVAEMYGYPYDGIDVGLCTKLEGFKVFP